MWIVSRCVTDQLKDFNPFGIFVVVVVGIIGRSQMLISLRTIRKENTENVSFFVICVGIDQFLSV